VTVWRLSRVIYQGLSGTGGLRYKGRWNEVGLPIVYTSASLALSVLERLVHSIQQPKDDVSIEIELPDNSIEPLAPLAGGWQEDFELTRGIGMEWLRSERSLCLKVPSVLVPDSNYLINPRHSDIGLVKVVAVKPFKYDSRLFDSSSLFVH
jgi:RES domain-containing protein